MRGSLDIFLWGKVNKTAPHSENKTIIFSTNLFIWLCITCLCICMICKPHWIRYYILYVTFTSSNLTSVSIVSHDLGIYSKLNSILLNVLTCILLIFWKKISFVRGEFSLGQNQFGNYQGPFSLHWKFTSIKVTAASRNSILEEPI